MNRTIFTIILGCVALALVAGCGGGQKEEPLHGTSTRKAQAAEPAPSAKLASFGEPMKLAPADAIPVAMVLANPAAYEGKYVRLTGNVSKVCERKGCWMEMSDAKTSQPMFVKFTCPVDGRLIPMNAIGKPVVAEGVVKVKEISQDDARHIKEESGATPEQVAKIVGPQKQITLDSPAAQVTGL